MIAQGFRIYWAFIVCAEVNPTKDKTSFNYYIKKFGDYSCMVYLQEALKEI